MTSKNRLKLRYSKIREVLEVDKENPERTEKETNLTYMTALESDQNIANTIRTNFIALTELDKTEIKFQVPSQRFDDAVEGGLKKTLSSPETKLANFTKS